MNFSLKRMNLLTRLLHPIKLNVSSNTFRSLQTQKISNVVPVFTQIPNATNPWIYQQNDHVKFPIDRINKIELPNGSKWVLPLTEPITSEIPVESPSSDVSNTPLEAAGLIVIRRKKMKKHKLRKLRKRMKFEWAKRRQRKELRREKLFQAKLIQQCKTAEAFSAEQYVQERIDKWKELTQTISIKQPHEIVNTAMKK